MARIRSRAEDLPRRCAALASKEVEPAPLWELEFEIGRRQYDTQYSARLQSLLETFVPIGRALGPAYRCVQRSRVNRLRAAPTAEGGPASALVAFETSLRVTPLPVSAREVERLFRACVGDVPDSAVRAISACPELLNLSGPTVPGPLGVLPGMIFAAVTRASYSARSKWP